MRTSKSVGFLAIGLGILLVVGAAVLPVSPATERIGPFRVGIRGDSCGPAAVVAARQPSHAECGLNARRRILGASAVGVVVVVLLGMALFAGGDDRPGSRIDVPSRRVRRAALRSPGSRRCTPG